MGLPSEARELRTRFRIRSLNCTTPPGLSIASNNNWQSDANAARVQEVSLAPNQPVESALDRTLSPGSYTVILRGVGSATGIGLIEVYDLTPAP